MRAAELPLPVRCCYVNASGKDHSLAAKANEGNGERMIKVEKEEERGNSRESGENGQLQCFAVSEAFTSETRALPESD